jgi:tRNA threonylcarbamoyladenosine biosynthesis protein TsaB
VFIEASLKEVGIAYKDLVAIAVSHGPGSYTGLRIGVSAAKGLCYALGIPLIAVDTLKILAAQAPVSDGLIIPMIDARRMEVYSAIFTSELESKRETRAEIIDEDSFGELTGPVYFVGDLRKHKLF